MIVKVLPINQELRFKELMTKIEMNICPPRARHTGKNLSAILTVAALSLFIFTQAVPNVFAQQKYSKTYPARKNIRIRLNNLSGPITVEGWQKDQIKISATIEAPAARFTPQMSDDGLVIDVVRDNQGREVGNINFKIYVPVNSTVDIETRYGDLSVANIESSMVRAHISLEGDISLTQIRSKAVMARNVSGDILFDGEILGDGVYTFQSTAGNINIRIPENSAFRLLATAPAAGNITLGSFANSGLSFIGGRKVVGNVGNASAVLSIMNQRGNISFIRR
jgi:hypothetical protein